MNFATARVGSSSIMETIDVILYITGKPALRRSFLALKHKENDCLRCVFAAVESVQICQKTKVRPRCHLVQIRVMVFGWNYKLDGKKSCNRNQLLSRMIIWDVVILNFWQIS